MNKKRIVRAAEVTVETEERLAMRTDLAIRHKAAPFSPGGPRTPNVCNGEIPASKSRGLTHTCEVVDGTSDSADRSELEDGYERGIKK